MSLHNWSLEYTLIIVENCGCRRCRLAELELISWWSSGWDELHSLIWNVNICAGRPNHDYDRNASTKNPLKPYLANAKTEHEKIYENEANSDVRDDSYFKSLYVYRYHEHH